MKKQIRIKWRHIRILLAVFLCSSIISCECQTGKDGFVNIFDGKTLAGWEGDPNYWKVENGNLVGEITPATLLKSNSFIIWKGGNPTDFELKIEYRITKSGNSGINYRSSQVKDVAHVLKGYQADIDGANRYSGQNYEERGRTTLAYRGEKVTVNALANLSDSLNTYIKNNNWTERTVTCSLGNSDSLLAIIKAEDWNTCHLIIKGNLLQHYINGILMSEVTDHDTVNRTSTGLLGVQVHVGPPMKVEYRNIRIKQLK